ncbi:hypothetical protein LOTGIDRAFT_236298 [Lottia gigantea]|uniref:TNFR-Cys domain-containing protein n=1 Tax=Lottia gigantea TaxID=225164 RepID=V3ZPE1_LOTGI|nr:hypothetical protein LOTGIDRAFT_236298 [Lottia gigantea]ESO84330.1 hypothetical protein LOTGIDRAFT_236298 [Lottia gigantea]
MFRIEVIGILTLFFWIGYVKGGYLCQPGTHCIANCKGGNNQPKCQDCPRGTFSTKENTASYCEVCRREEHCPLGTVFKNTCTSTTDNRCDCKDGSYWQSYDGYDGRCFSHSNCKEGEVVVKKGTATEDTKCGPKPTDTSSTGRDEKDSTGKHQPGTDQDGKDSTGTDGDVNHVLKPPGNGDAKGGSDRILTVPIILIVCMSGYAVYRMFIRYTPRLIHEHHND